jgi:hypothetical protein
MMPDVPDTADVPNHRWCAIPAKPKSTRQSRKALMRFIAILLTQEIGYRERELTFAVLASRLIVFADMQILANIDCPSQRGAMTQILANIPVTLNPAMMMFSKLRWQLFPAREMRRDRMFGCLLL